MSVRDGKKKLSEKKKRSVCQAERQRKHVINDAPRTEEGTDMSNFLISNSSN